MLGIYLYLIQKLPRSSQCACYKVYLNYVTGHCSDARWARKYDPENSFENTLYSVRKVIWLYRKQLFATVLIVNVSAGMCNNMPFCDITAAWWNKSTADLPSNILYIWKNAKKIQCNSGVISLSDQFWSYFVNKLRTGWRYEEINNFWTDHTAVSKFDQQINI